MNNGQITKEDYVHFQRLHMKQPAYVYVLVVVILAAVFSCYIATSPQWNSVVRIVSYLLPSLVFGVFIYIFYKHILPNQWMKSFEQNRELSLPFGMEIDESGITITTELGRSLRPWKHFVKWKEDEQMLLLYHADNMATILPKRMFDEKDIAFLHSMVETHQIPQFRSLLSVHRRAVILFLLLGAVLFFMMMLLVFYYRASVS
jgi:hypothetical protein